MRSGERTLRGRKESSFTPSVFRSDAAHRRCLPDELRTLRHERALSREPSFKAARHTQSRTPLVGARCTIEMSRTAKQGVGFRCWRSPAVDARRQGARRWPRRGDDRQRWTSTAHGCTPRYPRPLVPSTRVHHEHANRMRQGGVSGCRNMPGNTVRMENLRRPEPTPVSRAVPTGARVARGFRGLFSRPSDPCALRSRRSR
jgi:hypothetical protein